MFEYPVVYVDIETTGGSYRNSRVLEIALIRVEKGRPDRVFHTVLNPETYIPANITQLTGITEADTYGMPVFADVADTVQELVEGAIFIAHNVRFDYSFIKNEFSMIGRRFSPKLLCTVRLSRALYHYEKVHSLAKLIERHNIEVSDRHRALDDAKAMRQFTELAFREHGADLFNAAVQRQLGSQSLPPHLDPDDLAVIEDVPGVYIFKDETGLLLYVGKSITLRKRVLSHFQSTTSKELKLSQQTHRVETIQTGSELAALLLESRMVKELKPVYNRLLRRSSKYALLVRGQEGDYATVTIKSGEIDLETECATIYGIFKTRTAAKKKLLEVTRLFDLCPKLMGLEKASKGCFSYSLGKCRGGCIGRESAEKYNQRLDIALMSSRMPLWEFGGPIALPINEEGEAVVIDKWIIRGYLNSDGEPVLSEDEPQFDLDEFKIIHSFVRRHRNLAQKIAY